MLEQLRPFLLLPGNQPGLALPLFAGPAARLLGELRNHLLAEFRQRVQHCLGDLLDDMEFTDLVAGVRPQLLEHLGVKRRSVRGDARHDQAAFVQRPLELAQELADLLFRRVVIQDAESQAVVAAMVHDTEDAEGAVVDLVDGQVSGEVSQRFVEVGGRDAVYLFFSQRPRPSSGWWPKGRRRGGRATGANGRLGRASPLRRRDGRPVAGHGGCSGSKAKPGRK